MTDFGIFRVSFISDIDSSIGDDIAVYQQIEFDEATPQQFPCQIDDCSSLQHVDDDDDDESTSSLIEFYASESSEYRLSLAGLNCSCDDCSEHDDELYSKRYSSTLDSLRSQIMNFLPQTESMVSKSVISAFSSDCTHISCSSSSSSYGSSNSSNTDSSKTVADFVQDTREWVQELSSGDSEQYMQEQMDAVFVRVRNQELSTDDASRVVLGMAYVLGMEFAKPVPASLLAYVSINHMHENKENERSVHSSLLKENDASLLLFQQRSSNFGPLTQQFKLEFSDYASTSTTNTNRRSDPWIRRQRPSALQSQLRHRA